MGDFELVFDLLDCTVLYSHLTLFEVLLVVLLYENWSFLTMDGLFVWLLLGLLPMLMDVLPRFF